MSNKRNNDTKVVDNTKEVEVPKPQPNSEVPNEPHVHVHDENCTIWPPSVDLMMMVLSLVEESGCNQMDAECALEAAIALLPSFGEFDDEDL